MIERLRGVVVAKGADGVVIEVGGVGFRLEASSVTLREVPAVGAEMTILTHLNVREDALQLFGFSTEEERELFRLFIGVSKIGPKLALAALSCRRPQDLKRALAAGDVALFASVPGIGKKTAERLILELREKVGEIPGRLGTTGDTRSEESDAGPLPVARAALVELGFSLQEADKLLVDMEPGMSVEDMVRKALSRK
jgi:Holliday junction DNA helicase RuvA